MVTDGAAALLIMEAAKAKSLGLKPLGRIRGYAYAGCDPSRMGLGPVHATARVMKATSLRLRDMELVELNEAFAAQVLACLRAFESPSVACAGFVNSPGKTRKLASPHFALAADKAVRWSWSESLLKWLREPGVLDSRLCKLLLELRTAGGPKTSGSRLQALPAMTYL
jgi:hypothetical protein